jgi:hypothetical protein
MRRQAFLPERLAKMTALNNFQKWCARSLLILTILCLQSWGQPVVAQPPPPPEIVSLSPNEGWPGDQIEVTIRGSGFDEEVEVIVEGVELEVVRRSPQTLLVQLFIPGDAPPGPRNVIVINHVGEAQEAVLPRGFIVLGEPEEPTPTREEPAPTEPWEPPDEEDDGIPWEIVGPLLGLLAVIVVPTAAYLTLDAARRRRLLRQRQELERWQEEAQQELPRGDCRPGLKLPIIGRKAKPGTWEIVHLVFTAELSMAGQPYGEQHFVGGKIVQRLNEIAALRKRTGDEDRLRRMAIPLAQELSRLLWVWGRNDWRGRQVTLRASVEGKVTYEFRLYECQRTDEGNRWQKAKDWEGTIKETKEMTVGQLIGPQEREGKGNFQRRAAEALVEHLLTLTSDVSAIK